MIERAYPVDEEGIAERVWSYPSIFDDGRSAVLVSTQLQTDCWFRCGSIRQTELITENRMTRRIPVYFYQFGFIEEPWDQVSHGDDVYHLFGSQSDFNLYSENFSKIVQNFFGAYIRGEGVMIDDVDASIQNGKYIYIVDEVKAVDLSDLDVAKKRCQVMFDLGDEAFDNEDFCVGLGVDESFDSDTEDEMMIPEFAVGTTWTVTLTAKDLFILVLLVLNICAVTSVIYQFRKRPMGSGRKVRYRPVKVVADSLSENEQLQIQ